VDTTLFYRLPVASGRWQAVDSVLWGEGDSDDALRDDESFMINAGAMYSFGARAAPASAAQWLRLIQTEAADVPARKG
jgi:hypothetical protein